MPSLTTSKGTFQWVTLDERRDGVAHVEEQTPMSLNEAEIGRRQLLQVTSAAAAMVGLGGCFRQPAEKLMPYARRPLQGTIGLPLHFATGLETGGVTLGLLAHSREHHPIKVEGNPLHPGSLGATGPTEQASLFGLFDPTRARALTFKGQPATHEALRAALSSLATRSDGGRGLRFLVEPTASLSLNDAYRRVLKRYPRAKFVRFAPAQSENGERGAELAFGRPVAALPQLGAARVVVSLDHDFLSVRPQTLRAAHDFVEARRPGRLNRLYHVESSFSLTGAFADHRLRARPSQVPLIARAIAAEVGDRLDHAVLARVGVPDALPAEQRRWANVLADDLVAHRGESIVLVGPSQSPELHALGHLLNDALGNQGKTVELRAPLLGPTESTIELSELVDEMNDGRVDSLIITAWNPVFSAYADTPFGEALKRVATSISLTLHDDETAKQCTWVVPAQHPFETWRDGRAFDGTASILQPLIAPVFSATLDAWALLEPFLGGPPQGAYQSLRVFWKERAGDGAAFDSRWESWLAAGVIPDTALEPVDAQARGEAVVAALGIPRVPAEALELHFVVDTKLYDGRHANNAWLQELPDPMTQLTWGNAALMSPATARALGLESGQRARLSYRDRTIEAPAWVLPGHADGTVTLNLGYGAARSKIDEGGVNAYALRCADAPWADIGVTVKPLSGRVELALAQAHSRMEGRELALQRAAEGFEPDALEHLRSEEPVFYPPEERLGVHRWAMAIDLNRCIGCSACVVACQAENNIPAVGKAQVRRGREMHWLRIDRYFMGEEDEPTAITQPVACVHCERAPCEYVCPVNATVHSDEGLNEMVYNRCIGTRYCSNNCPYKVRRFNYLNYTERSPLESMVRNPEVTVRSRGVMEKCTYCVQRIEQMRIKARIETRPIRDGEVKTACQQVCPTHAIVFGDLADPDTQVSAAHRNERRYELLHELGTRPRTVHLVRLKNLNEALP